jgi:2,5-furandicarboxylate decarboxylase 1
MTAASLRTFLDGLPSDEVLHISDEIDLDYFPTALVLELEKKKRFPVVHLSRPKGYDVPVIANVFSDRGRIARIAGVNSGEFNDAWTRAIERLVRPEIVQSAPVQEKIHLGSEADAGKLPVCTENSILVDYVSESPNVSGDDRSVLPLPGPVGLAIQVEEPT